MTEKEIVSALRVTESRSKRELLDAAADLIERMTARCARYAEEIAVAQERQRWIPVTERLPDQCMDVLVRYRDKHILMGTARCDDWLDEDLEDGEITHWMPLPEWPAATPLRESARWESP